MLERSHLKKPSRLDVFKALFVDANSAQTNGEGMLGFSDSIYTPIRNWQVYSNGLVNDALNGADNSDNPQAHYNQSHYHHGSAEHGLTSTGQVTAGLLIAAPVVGLARIYYQNYHQQYLNSLAYLHKRMRTIDKLAGVDHDKLLDENGMKIFIATNNQKILSNIEKGDLYRSNLNRDEDNNTYLTIERTASVKLASKQRKLNKPVVNKTEINPVFKAINKLSDSTLGRATGKVWNYLLSSAFTFWIIWMPVAFIAGAAAIASGPILAAVVIATMAITSGVMVWRKHNESKVADRKNRDLGYIEGVLEFDLDAINVKSSLTQQNIKKIDAYLTAHDSHYQNYSIKKKAESIYPVQKRLAEKNSRIAAKVSKQFRQRLFMKYEHSKMSELLEKWKQHNPARATHRQLTMAGAPNTVEKLRHRLKGSDFEHGVLAATTFLSKFILGIIIPLFFCWMGSSFIASASFLMGGNALLSGIADTLGSATTAMSIAGGAFSSILGINALIDVRKTQAAHKNKVEAVLSSAYKQTGKSKSEVFVELEAKMDALIARAKQGGPAFLASLKQAGYDVSKIDVYNDYYFEKQKHQPSAFSQFKKIGNRVFEVFKGFGTGFTLPRALLFAPFFLAGTITAFTIGAPVLLIAIGLAIGAVLAVTGVVKYQLERNQQHREHFVGHIDDRISYMSKRIKELQVVLGDKQENKSQMLGIAARLRTRSEPAPVKQLDGGARRRALSASSASSSVVNSSLFARASGVGDDSERSFEDVSETAPLLLNGFINH